MSRSSGLHVPVLELVRAQGVDVVLGRSLEWLTGRGHLADAVQAAPTQVREALARVHQLLGGSADLLGAKRLGNPPTPDLVHVPTGTLIEVDEVQHFTTARLASLQQYPDGAPLGFDLEAYRELCDVWRVKADRAFKHRVSADFPQSGGRQAQRAYNDALRDLLAPMFTGRPVIRIGIPDRDVERGAAELVKALRTE